MEILTRLAKNLLILFVSVLLITSLSCSDDPSSPKKEDEDPIPQEIVTIGVEGGTVEKGDLKITIHEGAFNDNHDLTITLSQEDRVFGESSVSSSYKLTGLPNDYLKPIIVNLKYNGDLSGKNFISVGKKFFDFEKDDYSRIYDMILAKDSSSVLIAEISSDSSSGLNKNNNSLNIANIFDDLLIEGLSKDEEHTFGNFDFVFPISLSAKVEAASVYFNEAYEIIINDLGWVLFTDKRNIKAVVVSQPELVKAALPDWWMPLINVSWDDLSEGRYGELKQAAGVSILDLELQQMREIYKLKEVEGYWLDEAFKEWSKTLFTDYSTPSPTDGLEYSLAPLSGLRLGLLNSDPLKQIRSHGKGLGSMIKYLLNTNLLQSIKELPRLYLNYDHFQDPYKALEAVTEISLTDWWPDYIKDYIAGNIYDIPISHFIDNTNFEWNINSNSDTLKSFPSSDPRIGKYNNLASKLFKINLNNSTLDESQNMILNMSTMTNESGLTLIVYGINNGNAEYLGTAFDQDFEIANLKSYYDIGTKQFLCVLVNNIFHQEEIEFFSDIDLNIEVTPKVEAPACSFDPSLYDQCRISLVTLVKRTTLYDDNQTKEESGFEVSGTPTIDGAFNGNTFKGIFEHDSGADTVTVVINDNLNMVESAIWSSTVENPNWGILWVRGGTVENIPLNCVSKNKFEVTGLDVCSKIADLRYNYSTPTYTTTITDITCEESSTLIIEFSKK